MSGERPKQEAQPDPYAGRWVALLNGQVVAQGGSPEQALKAAKAARPKEKPEIQFMPSRKALALPAIIQRISALIPEDQRVFLVGGAVRDLMLQRQIRDFDFTLAGPAIPLARKLADKLDGAFYVLDEERDAGRILLNEDGQSLTLDFVAQREASLEANLKERDFTINAMALDLQQADALLDPLGGAADLQTKKLRACSPSAMQDDPVRVLRAVRMAASFGLRIEKQTREWMKAASGELSDVSAERLRDELFRLLSAPKVAISFRALEMLGALKVPLPELTALKEGKLWERTLQRIASLEKILVVLDINYPKGGARDLYAGLIMLRLGRYREQISSHLAEETVSERPRRSLLFMAALYIDVGEEIAERAESLRLSNEEIATLKMMVGKLELPDVMSELSDDVDRRSIYRFFRETGKAGVDICLLSLADLMGSLGAELSQDALAAHIDTIRELLEAYWERYDEMVSPTPLLNGDDLMAEFGLEASARIGEILEALREAQAAGEIKSEKEALKFAKGLAEN